MSTPTAKAVLVGKGSGYCSGTMPANIGSPASFASSLILQGYTLCVIDAEGDCRTLESLPGMVVFGGDTPPPELPDLSRVLRHPHMSAVVDLSHASYREKVDYMNTLLPILTSLRRATGLPYLRPAFERGAAISARPHSGPV
jgi:hypothetical protein